MLRSLLRRFLESLGKSDRPIIAVFAASSAAYREAVDYVRREVPQFPVWLVAAAPVAPEVASRCERAIELRAGVGLPVEAARLLWAQWVVLSVVTLTGERGYLPLKLAPLLAPPWKVLVMNEHGDFFNALPFGLLRHGLRRARDRMVTSAVSGRDLLLGVFWKIAWTALDPLLALTRRPWLGPAEPAVLAPEAGAAGIQVFGDEASLSDEDRRNLETLLERPDTFAAGIQPGRAGFQRDVLPRAAFRQLQPGEASAVVAPLADVLLFDGAKLARLGGLPKARSRRCGWLLLFFRAAAAGWKSYSVGAVAASRLPMIPDRAFPEAEFCFRLLRDKRRRQPGTSFDARRGSVCFQVRRARHGAGRRILMVSPYLPFPLAHGGAVRIFNLARHLSKRWELLLLTFRERQDHIDYERLQSVFAEVLVVDHDERRRADPAVPEAVAQFRSRAMTAAIREAAAVFQPLLLQVEYTQLAGYREALPQTPAVLVEHDVTFSLHEQLGAQREFELWYRYESHWLKQYDAVAVMSEEEKEKAVGAGAPPERVWVAPNGVDIERFRPSEQEPGAPSELLYVGSFRHLPNLLGFEHLRREIMPRLWARFPDLRARVVAGPEHQKYWKPGPLDHRIVVEGFVEDLAPHYRRARLAMVPLTVSAGTNIKVLEALACGKPVVSTPVGCAGLGLADEEEILIAGNAEQFAVAVRRVLEDAALARRLGENARRAAVERFSWERSAQCVSEIYDSLLPTVH